MIENQPLPLQALVSAFGIFLLLHLLLFYQSNKGVNVIDRTAPSDVASIDNDDDAASADNTPVDTPPPEPEQQQRRKKSFARRVGGKLFRLCTRNRYKLRRRGGGRSRIIPTGFTEGHCNENEEMDGMDIDADAPPILITTTIFSSSLQYYY